MLAVGSMLRAIALLSLSVLMYGRSVHGHASFAK